MTDVVKLCIEDNLRIHEVMPTHMNANNSMKTEVANEVQCATCLIISFVHNSC